MNNKSMKVGKLGNKKKGLITKTWERCKSIGRGGGHNSSMMVLPLTTPTTPATRRSKSWPSNLRVRDRNDEEKRSGKKKKGVAPEGCFSVYVGQQMQRFVIKTEHANHPLFQTLLEEAESEYGYSSQGPLALPCEVDIFCKVLMEIDDDASTATTRQGCVFRNASRSTNNYRPSSGATIPLLMKNHF